MRPLLSDNVDGNSGQSYDMPEIFLEASRIQINENTTWSKKQGLVSKEQVQSTDFCASQSKLFLYHNAYFSIMNCLLLNKSQKILSLQAIVWYWMFLTMLLKILKLVIHLSVRWHQAGQLMTKNISERILILILESLMRSLEVQFLLSLIKKFCVLFNHHMFELLATYICFLL